MLWTLFAGTSVKKSQGQISKQKHCQFSPNPTDWFDLKISRPSQLWAWHFFYISQPTALLVLRGFSVVWGVSPRPAVGPAPAPWGHHGARSTGTTTCTGLCHRHRHADQRCQANGFTSIRLIWKLEIIIFFYLAGPLQEIFISAGEAIRTSPWWVP